MVGPVTFDMRVEDLKAFTTFSRKRSFRAAGGNPWLGSAIWLAVVLGVLYLFAMIVSERPGRVVLWFIVGVVALIAFGLILLHLQQRRATREAPRNEARLDEEGLHTVSVQGETSYRWSAVTKLGETDRYFFIEMTGNLVQIVPKRAMDAAGVEAWRAGLREYAPDIEIDTVA